MQDNHSEINIHANQDLLSGESVKAVRLEELAHRVARKYTTYKHVGQKRWLSNHLLQLESLLNKAYRHFARASEEGMEISYGAEWLLDNFYIVQRALRQVGEDMPKSYYRQLPKLEAFPFQGYPRVYALAGAIISYCEGRLDLRKMSRFAQAYQQIALLTMGELWALPTMLHLGMAEILIDAAARLAGLQSQGNKIVCTILESPLEVKDEDAIANGIISLRTLATQDWEAFFESISQVERILRSDPAKIYARMDFETRDRYRNVVEELARATERDESDVAREVIGLAKDALKKHESLRFAHVGFYILDSGRVQLEALIGFRPSTGLRLRRWILAHPTLVYLSGIALISLVILLGLVNYTLSAGGNCLYLIATIVLALVPAMSAAVSLINWIITRTVTRRVLPKMDFWEGIPAEYSSMVVIPALLTQVSDVESLSQQLELHYLGNADPHLLFGLLTDFEDAPQKEMPGDKVLLDLAKNTIQALNEKYSDQVPGPFYIFHRERKWNPIDNCWMGWERKRGKLVELNNLILNGSSEIDKIPSKDEGDVNSFVLQMGNLNVLPKTRYIITLDTDTSLPPGSARRLIATLAHPLNHAEFDPESGAVVSGYTVIQPRIEIRPKSVNQSLFTRIFAGDAGLDLYTRAVSDVYQDFFGEGIYTGKGIFDVAGFERSLSGRVPENSLLSHDLFEGIHGRAGLATDISLFEDYPPQYLAYTSRMHRWVRGDWQLLPWLLPRVPSAGGGTRSNDLSIISRWKILDNLRRSLLAPALLALLITGWLWLPGSALAWTVAGLTMSAAPLIVSILIELNRRFRGATLHGCARSVSEDAIRWLLALASLPYEAFVVIDAIGSTLVRLAITHRHLLQWTTSAHTIRLLSREWKVAVIWKRMGSIILAVPILAYLIGMIRVVALPIAAPLLAIWFLSPEIVYQIGRPLDHKPDPLSAEQQQKLRCLARRTWFYFEQFVGPDDHWLPPDHFQEKPRGLVSHSTSPTNLGLMLTSVMAAFDLGYLGPLDLVLRLRATFESMSQLERCRGHFFNWYDTSTLEPLHPRYISTVDSGNIAACLLVLKQGCRDLLQEPALRWERWQGLLDALTSLDWTLNALQGEGLEDAVEPLQAYLKQIRQQVLAVRGKPQEWSQMWASISVDGWRELSRLILSLINSGAQVLDISMLKSLRIDADLIHYHLFTSNRDLDVLLPWLSLRSKPPALLTHKEINPGLMDAWQMLLDALSFEARLGELADVAQTAQVRLAVLANCLTDEVGPADEVEEARTWCESLSEKLDSARMATEAIVIGIRDLGEQAGAYCQDMDFRFLFDKQRKIFHIGYDADANKLDPNYYDLLASEARIASLLAIAKGDVPPSHWLQLGRPLTQVNGRRVLLSWGGSMFEYLMPSLLLRDYEGTLLDQSCRPAVDSQMAYGHEKGVPWGISESGYYAFDASMNYQYRSFGVPELGYRRGMAEDLVIAPYASLLAVSLRPKAVIKNILDLQKLGMIGKFGFYEAIDFTQSRMNLGQDYAIICSYMAHHQGMILLALDNYLKSGAMVRRFHSDPRVMSVEFLLQERAPAQAPVEYPRPEAIGAIHPARPTVSIAPWRVDCQTPLPQVNFLSNGSYGVMITSAGSGFSQWRDVGLTRWRADATLDRWGTWIYIEDKDSGDLWSACYQPVASTPQSISARFYAHKVEFRRRENDIFMRMEITVPPDDDVEIRRITLINHSAKSRRLMITSYGEVVLTSQIADARHPAFNRLFIESEYISDVNTLLFHRRPRSAEEDSIYMAHSLVVEHGHDITGMHESDRKSFLGRGRTTEAPAALAKSGPGLSCSVGDTLDPIMAISQEIKLKPYAKAQVAFITLAASSREKALSLAHRYQTWAMFNRAFDRARIQSEHDLRQSKITGQELQRIQQLLSVMLYPNAGLRADSATLSANSEGQAGLWAYGISGDYPIILARIGGKEETDLVCGLLRAHAYWRRRQIKIDLVILNQRETGYSQELHGKLRQLISRANCDGWLNQRGGIFLLRGDQMSEADRVLLASAARAVFDGGKGSLAKQMMRLRESPFRLPRLMSTMPSPKEVEPTPAVVRPSNLLFDNGLGGFSLDGREYIIYLEPGQQTPAPWINVIANPDFGFLVSEAGAGYTWAKNSGENRLTPWRNDPVADEPGEAFYLRDEETGLIWSPTPAPAGDASSYLIHHGAGYSIFEHNSHGLKQRLRLFAIPDAPIKVVELRLENVWNRNRRITATYYAEWVLGADRETSQQYIVPGFDAGTNALLARNPYNTEFAKHVAFLAASKEPHGLTTDRTEFLGRMGSFRHPAALDRVGLAGAVKAGLDPCAAIQLHIEMGPGEAKSVFFLVGEGSDRKESIRLIKKYQNEAQIEAAWKELNEFWDSLMGVVTVQTPDAAMDLLLNRWLIYQTLACRIWARSAFYQASGAFGFRDQLQDVMALVYAAPDIFREHILRASGRQFEEGDVLHWWHPPSGRGVRTRCSDDLLWLPYVTAEYIDSTGDLSILSEKVPFLKSKPLEPEEHERYGLYQDASDSGTLYQHCIRALEKGSTKGSHGLPLMGSGDWNDGLNRVGIEGKGESIWLGWFLCATLTRFAPICESIGEDRQAAIFRHRAQELRQALEGNAWDGEWYLRAYNDEGKPLGSHTSSECQIDSIAQSWAVLSGSAEDLNSMAEDASRAAQAMDAVAERLVRADDQLLLLFTPPFDKTAYDPGYIKGYPPGVRENGGQYTHAALWAVWAFAKLGQGDRAYDLLRMLNPICHSNTPDKAIRYGVEPYVVAADIYSMPPYIGRGGWTWYTGSASWMYRLCLEAILGLRRTGKVLRIDPCIPKDWPGYALVYRYGKTTYEIRVENTAAVNRGVNHITLDGKSLAGKDIPLLNDGQHHKVNVEMG
jgi:cyclic beta-1,2-glucan synthetase